MRHRGSSQDQSRIRASRDETDFEPTCGLIAGVIAQRKQHSFGTFFVLGFPWHCGTVCTSNPNCVSGSSAASAPLWVPIDIGTTANVSPSAVSMVAYVVPSNRATSLAASATNRAVHQRVPQGQGDRSGRTSQLLRLGHPSPRMMHRSCPGMFRAVPADQRPRAPDHRRRLRAQPMQLGH